MVPPVEEANAILDCQDGINMCAQHRASFHQGVSLKNNRVKKNTSAPPLLLLLLALQSDRLWEYPGATGEVWFQLAPAESACWLKLGPS